MLLRETMRIPAELRYLDGEPEGTIGGYGSVWESPDSYGDVVTRGAFAETLAAHRANGTMPSMYVEHSAFTGGDPLPVGAWDEMVEDEKGLRVKGHLVALDHPDVRRVHVLMREKPRPLISGLSIAFTVPEGGAIRSNKAGEPKRRVNRMNLFAVDLVADPSANDARISSVRSAGGDAAAAAAHVANAIALHREAMTGSSSPNSDQRAAMLLHLQNAHMALTGCAMPPGMRFTLREFEAWLGTSLGLSNAEARSVSETGFKAFLSRDATGGKEPTEAEVRAALEAKTELADALAGFSLPTFS